MYTVLHEAFRRIDAAILEHECALEHLPLYAICARHAHRDRITSLAETREYLRIEQVEGGLVSDTCALLLREAYHKGNESQERTLITLLT